jgi:hypothetical protein
MNTTVSVDDLLMRLGQEIFLAINESYWESTNTSSIDAMMQSATLLKLEVFLKKINTIFKDKTSDCVKLQQSLIAYISSKNISLSTKNQSRLSSIIAHFSTKKPVD